MTRHVTDLNKIRQSRLTAEYLVNQVENFRKSETYQDHKGRINDSDLLYDGRLNRLFPDEEGIGEDVLVDNSFRRAIHDIPRLAAAARGAPVFFQRKDGIDAAKAAQLQNVIAETLWELGRGRDQERKLYMDILGTGFAAVAVYFNEDSDYPQYMRLDPRLCYPETYNGALQSMLYMEYMKRRKIRQVFPDLEFEWPEADDDRVEIVVQYFDDYEVTRAIVMKDSAGKAATAFIDEPHRWVHGLDCVPVAFEEFDTYDGAWRGAFDQVGGPLMIRNKISRLLAEYIEDMVHAPREAKGVMNATDTPGPLLVYQHDPTAAESFIRRVPPAAPAASVWNLLQYLGGQEAQTVVQPPARVGTVQYGSGSFVAQTQGSLTSLVEELQDHMAKLRVRINRIAMQIDEKHLDFVKPLIKAVGKKATYKPSTAIDGWYNHKIIFGAAAGLDKASADVRVLNHVAAGIISKKTARKQVDYLDDPTNEQDEIDRENLANALFQRIAGDPAVPSYIAAQGVIEMGKGKTLIEAMEVVAPELVKAAQQQAAAGPIAPGEIPPEPTTATPGQLEGLAAGQGAPPGSAQQEIEFAPPPLLQLFGRAG